MKPFEYRRRFFIQNSLLMTGGAFTTSLLFPFQRESKHPKSNEAEETGPEDIAPPEDLMREHGVLNRVLLIYDEIQHRLNGGKEFPPEVLSGAAGIIRNFIENYHEKLEEDYLFPRFEKAGKLVELVRVLREQHLAGRQLTARIQKGGTAAMLKNEGERKALSEDLRLFARMYRPHEAREDTVLFPAIRTVVSPREFDELGDQFEDKEHALFGKEGFEGIVVEVAKLEKALSIYELSQFTPKEVSHSGS
ncbi:MAG: hemerythrin domain-containing protein [Terriglobia bacterium]